MVDVDDGGSMDPNEILRIQLFLESRERPAQQKTSVVRVQSGVVALGFYPADIGGANEML